MVPEGKVREVLRTVIDPELGINIVDLGLIYGIELDEENNVNVIMTLTTPGCPLHDSIQTGVHNAVSRIEGIGEVNVNLVWFPPWSPEKMSEEAKQLLMF